MTENERKAIDTLQDMITEGQSNGDVIVARDDEEELNTAIQAIEEIQQYRAIGTVEELKSLKDNGAFSGIELAQIASMQMKLKEYQSIGTIEEFKALKEKNVAKKAKWIFDDFTATFGNPYHCSNCDEEFGDTYNYCPNCGCSMYD